MPSESKMIQLAALWKSKSGNSLHGYFGDARIVIIPNKHKSADKHPDYIVLIAPKEPKPDGAAQAQDQGSPGL